MREKHPLFKEISGWKSNTPPFFTFLGPDFVARKVPLYRTFWQHACGHFETWVGGREFRSKVEAARSKAPEWSPPNRRPLAAGRSVGHWAASSSEWNSSYRGTWFTWGVIENARRFGQKPFWISVPQRSPQCYYSSLSILHTNRRFSVRNELAKYP